MKIFGLCTTAHNGHFQSKTKRDNPKYIDSSISSTVNLKRIYKTVADIYMHMKII